MKQVTIFFLVLLVGLFNTEAKTKHSRSSSSKPRSSRSKATKRVIATPIPQGRFSAVVIDAGHGGHDFGGIRQNIIPEKHVALDVALRLSKALEAAGLRTFLTRRDDTFVTLGGRVALANAHPEAIFVCVHFNSGRRVGARGIETFYASPNGAALAARIQR